MQSPFETSFAAVEADLDFYVARVFERLQTEFLVMPKGEGFVEYETFDAAYETLKSATGGFRSLTPEAIAPLAFDHPLTMVVLRCILGLTPPEWATVASEIGDIEVPQGAARTLDRQIRMRPRDPLPRDGVTAQRVRLLVTAACDIADKGSPAVSPRSLHRYDKVDTKAGNVSLTAAATLGVPYSMLLYERLLGRPFASHRDSVSELVGDVVENAIEGVLSRAGISYRRTSRADRLPGFDQAPDFVIPNEHNPKVVIEAKLSEDDGTARDKITRVQHLAEISQRGQPAPARRFELIACIAGRGFGVRREDMKKLLIATSGKVFTLQDVHQLVEHTRLREYRSQ